jgi:prepilin-type N-terminal cleavage/methylation domain-containing protein
MKQPKLLAKRGTTNHDGFTLIEVVIAAVLVGISVAGVWGLISWLMYTTNLSNTRTRATYYAEEKMEEILSQSMSSGSDSTGTFVRTWTITPVDASRTDVEVVISWVDPRQRTNTITMNSALVNAVTSFTGVAFSDLFTGGPG